MKQFHAKDAFASGTSPLLGRTQPPLTVTAAIRRLMAVPGTSVHHGSRISKATGVTVTRGSERLPSSVMLPRGKRCDDDDAGEISNGLAKSRLKRKMATKRRMMFLGTGEFMESAK